MWPHAALRGKPLDGTRYDAPQKFDTARDKHQLQAFNPSDKCLVWLAIAGVVARKTKSVVGSRLDEMLAQPVIVLRQP